MADGYSSVRGKLLGGKTSPKLEIARRRLTADQHRIAHAGATEPAFTAGNHHDETRNGSYCCAVCDAEVFNSAHKFDARTGWPAFFQPATPEAVSRKLDFRLVLPRVAAHCTGCGSHLGLIYKDGPAPTGLRYTVNGSLLVFHPAGDAANEQAA